MSIQIIRALPELMTALHIASLGFVQDESEALAQDVANHLRSGKLVYRIVVGKQDVGFAIFAVYGDILYLSGIILVPGYQARGICGLVIQEGARINPICTYLALRTQSLRMFRAATKLCLQSYPQLGGDRQIPDEFARRGHLVAKLIKSEFPVHRGCYGGPLYGEKPLYKDAHIQNSWDCLCNFARGDAVIFIGRFR